MTHVDAPSVKTDKPKSAGDRSRQKLLLAARGVFAAHGLNGARVDEIARQAGINKQMVYHYFGNKEGLYSAVIAEVYAEIRNREKGLVLSRLPAEEAMRKLIEFSFDFLNETPDFVRIIVDVNQHGARHLDAVEAVQEINQPIIDLIEETLARGVDHGVFRDGHDPLHLYLSIAGMSFFYFANMHTLSRAFSVDLSAEAAILERRAHIVDFTLNAIRVRSAPA